VDVPLFVVKLEPQQLELLSSRLDDAVVNATAFVDVPLFVVKLEPQQLELLSSRLDDAVVNATAFVDVPLFVVKIEPQQLDLLSSRLQQLVEQRSKMIFGVLEAVVMHWVRRLLVFASSSQPTPAVHY
jgi:hypothetical protein